MITSLNGISIYELSGLIGVVFYLGSYAALQFKLLDSDDIQYPLFNFAAASFVLFSLQESFNMSSALIQVSWIAISGYGIITFLLSRTNKEADTAS